MTKAQREAARAAAETCNHLHKNLHILYSSHNSGSTSNISWGQTAFRAPVCAAAHLPVDGWPGGFKLPVSLSFSYLFLCFDGNYQYVIILAHWLPVAESLLPPPTVDSDCIDVLPLGGNGSSCVTRYRYIIQHQRMGNWRLCFSAFREFYICIYMHTLVYMCNTVKGEGMFVYFVVAIFFMKSCCTPGITICRRIPFSWAKPWKWRAYTVCRTLCTQPLQNSITPVAIFPHHFLNAPPPLVQSLMAWLNVRLWKWPSEGSLHGFYKDSGYCWRPQV